MRIALLLGLWVGWTVQAQPAAPDSVVITDAHYRVYTTNGEPASLDAVVEALRRTDVIFLGEQHDDPVGHWLEARLLERAHAAYGATRPVALSLEMIEQDAQLVLDEYLGGTIRERDFLAASRPWSNYATDYRPLVEYAKTHGLPVLAANAPARYTNLTSRRSLASLDSLAAAARAFLPPLPIAPPSETLAAKFMGLMGGMGAHGSMPGMPSVANMLAAQNLRDASMGYHIAQYLARQSAGLVVHVNGSFHSEEGLGVPEHVARYRPGARLLIVTMRPAEDPSVFNSEAHAGLGSFVILTDASLPRTYATSS